MTPLDSARFTQEAASITLGELFDSCGIGMMTLAELDGALTSIAEVPSGASGCICPCCKKGLVARKGKIVSHHFAHMPSDDDISCRQAAETILHRYAKEVIAREKVIRIPSVIVEDEFGPLEVCGEKTIRLEDVRLERRWGGLVPDVTATSGGRTLLVEFLVTHPCSDEKIALLRKDDIGVVEVDLSEYRACPLSSLDDKIVLTAPRSMLVGRQYLKGQFLLEERKASRMANIDAISRELISRLKSAEKRIVKNLSGPFQSYERTYIMQFIDRSPGPLNFFIEPEAYWKSRVVRRFLRDRRKKWIFTDLLNDLGEKEVLASADEAEFFAPVSQHLRENLGIDASTLAESVKRFLEFMISEGWLFVDERNRYCASERLVSPLSRKAPRVMRSAPHSSHWWNDD